jgi:peroxiredoxin
MFGISRYNYPAFTRDVLERDIEESRSDGGPQPGDRAPTFEAPTLAGEKIRLRDFRGRRNVVLTFGSATCPMTAGSMAGINHLYAEYNGDEVQFLFVYVREAHPGERVPAHASQEAKLRAAQLLRDEEDVAMPIVVDDVHGRIHRKYGKLPNPTFVIDQSGRIAFRALWTRPKVVEDALLGLLERQRDRGVEHVIVNGGEDRSMPLSYAMVHAHRALERGGPQAVSDFRRALGVPGRVALAASRIAEPIALNPGRAFAAAAIAGGVLTAGLLAGRALRAKRLGPRAPYDVYEAEERPAPTGTDYSEPVGI